MQKLYKSLSHLFIVLFLGVMPNRPRFNFSFCILNSTFSIKVILLTFFLFTSSFSQAQWVAQMHSPKSAQTIAMGTDDAENVYVAGVFTDSLYLFSRDRAQQLSNITGTGLALSVSGWTLLTQKAVNNVFLCKYDSAGTLKWAKVLGTVNTQSEPRRNYLSLEADKAGNTYLFGYWNNNSTIPGFETTEKKPGLIKFDTQGERVWTKDIVPASAGFEGYLTKSTKDEELFLNISTNQAFTFGGEAFGQNTASTWAIDGATGVQRVVSNLPGASPMVVYPCENKLYRYGNNQLYRDSVGAITKTVLSITGSVDSQVEIVKVEIDSLGYFSGVGKFKGASITVAGQGISNSRPELLNTTTPGWDVFVFKVKKDGSKVWVRNVLSWEKGNGNGYIGMALNSVGEIELGVTLDTLMKIIGQSAQVYPSSIKGGGYFRFSSFSSDYYRSQITSNSGQVSNVLDYSKLGSLLFSSDYRRSFFQRIKNVNYNVDILKQTGNGLMIGKGFGGTPPPSPPFSTKYLYCNTVMGTTTGIADYVDENVKVYPNPSEGNFIIESNYNNVFNYSIYSLQGTVIQSGWILNKASIAIKEKGLYLLQLTTTNGNMLTKKILIE